MKKLIAVLAALSITVVGGIAIADDPDGDIQRVRDLLAQADAILAQEQAKPPAVVTITETVTATVTQTVTAPPTIPPPTTTTTPPPTTTTTTPPPTTTTTPPPPPPVGFPTRQELLTGAVTTASSGKLTLLAHDRGYDARGWSWTTSERFPVALGTSTSPQHNAGIVGGTYQGTFDRSLVWDQMHSGAVVLARGDGYLVVYDLRADNVPDFFRPRPPVDGNLASQQSARWLLDGCYGSYVRDDAVENDQELTGTVNDCLFDSVFMGVSIGQSNKNPAAVTTVTNSTFIFKPMPAAPTQTPDGSGHAAFFKQLGSGRVVLRNVNICYTEMDLRGNLERMGRWMPGTYENVKVVLGSGWTDAQAAAFPPVPPGVTVSRDWSICTSARDAWLAAH